MGAALSIGRTKTLFVDLLEPALISKPYHRQAWTTKIDQTKAAVSPAARPAHHASD